MKTAKKTPHSSFHNNRLHVGDYVKLRSDPSVVGVVTSRPGKNNVTVTYHNRAGLFKRVDDTARCEILVSWPDARQTG